MNLDFEFQKVINNLEQRFNFEKKEDSKFDFFKLDRSLKLMDLLESPNESNALNIHIAGTNGKGSVSSLLSSVLSLNYKVGLYSSPHLYDYTERIKINKKNISRKDFIHIYNFIEKKILEYEKMSGKTFSFFEVLTAMSFIYFKKNKVDINVIETGIGGTYDTTNVIKSDIQVITPISYDHQNVLGGTIKSISENKAGIIKENSTVITSKQIGEALEIIRKKSAEKKSKLIELNYSIKSKLSIKDFRMNTLIEINGNEYKISSSAPSSPSNGDLWFDTTNNVLKNYNGNAWLGITSNSGIADVVDDTSPQLGGTLDGQNNNMSNIGTIDGANLQLDFGTI